MRRNANNREELKNMEKGQIFSLDFIIALVAVTAATGLLIQTAEVNMYYQKEATESNGLKSVAETAADLIVAHNETTCQDSSGNHLMNCIRTDIAVGELENIIEGLVPSPGYGFEITGFGGTASGPPPLQDKDFYQVKRRIVIGSETGPEQTLAVKVWLQ